MAQDLSVLVRSSLEKHQYSSLAMDESCDATDSAQLLIYIRYMNNFYATEEFLSLHQLVNTPDQNFLSNVTKTVWHRKQSSLVFTQDCMS